jgi:signal transduction histidine kinase
LTTRLIGLLVLVQTGVAIAGMTSWMLFSPFVSFDDVAAETTRRLVTRSVAGGPGGPALVPTAALVAYGSERPGLVYAALQDNKVLPGSSPALAEILSRLGPVLPGNGQIDARASPGDGLIRFASLDSPVGPLVIASRGDRFGPGDLRSFVEVFLIQLVPLFGPAILAAVLIVPLVVWRTLRPVAAAAQMAGEIEVGSLDRRMPIERLPRELLPFAQAINDLLRRLDDGVARQRLFTANAAHELRTPVAILEARIDGLSAGADRNGLKRSVGRIRILLNQLLAVARLGQREIKVDEDLDVAALVRSVVADCAPLALRSGRAIDFNADAGDHRVRANRQALAGALANLIDNALGFEPVGGKVVVTVARGPQAAVSVLIEDHGPGIPEPYRVLVFEPFWRKEETKVGSGLGLSIAAEIARLHGGSIEALETAGGGATMRLTLPAVASPIRVSRQVGTSSA